MDHDESQDDQFRRDPIFSDHSQRFVFVLCLLGALALAAFFGAQPARRWFESRTATRYAAEAAAFLESKELDLAQVRLDAALRLAPKDPAILRTAGRLGTAQQSPAGLTYWQVLLATPDATRADQLAYLELALDLGRTDLAGALLKDLLAADATNPDILRLATRQLRLTGQDREALLTAQAWHQANPSDGESSLALVDILGDRRASEDSSERLATLTQLATTDTPAQSKAIELLAAEPGLSAEAARQILADLDGRQNVSVPVRLAATGLRVRLNPEAAGAILASLPNSLPKPLDDSSLAMVGNWLVDHGGATEALRVVTLERAQQRNALLVVRMRALATLNQWTELEALTKSDVGRQIDPYVRHCFAAAMDKHEGRQQTLTGHLENAVQSCSNQVVALEFVANYAEALGQIGPAITAHGKLMRFPNRTLASGRKILELAHPLDSVRLELNTLRTLGDFVPEDQGILQEHAYLSFLVNERAENLLEPMRAFSKKHPENLAARCILALGELRALNPAAALALIDATDMAWDRAQPRWWAVRVAVLGANQQRVAARELARRIDLAALKTEERTLIAPWLNQGP